MQARHLFRCLLVLLATLMAGPPLTTRAAPSAAGAWTMTGSMHQARALQTATLLPSGLVLVAGGSAGQSSLASAELYHPRTGSWAGTGSLHHPRGEFTATLLHDGQVLVAGGCGTGDCSPVLASAELYNPRTGAWTLTGSMHEPRVFQTMTLLPNGQVLVAGGVANGCPNTRRSGVLASAELYDPRTGRWTLTSPMHQARARHTATLLPDGQVLVTGGAAGGARNADTNSLTSAELYNPRTGTWTATGSMHDARWSATADLLAGGVVLVAGGYSDNGPVFPAEIYHPRTGVWTVAGSLNYPRAYETAETATLLPSGQVLIAGSYEGAVGGNSSYPGASAEIYHPRTGAWSATSSMHDPRMAQTATLLLTGQVLVVGGCSSQTCSTILASAELYHA